MAFTYYTPFAIAGSQFAGTLTDFPVLISVTDNRFKTSGGGHVADANGYDLRPYDNSGLSTGALAYNLEFFDGTAGTVVMWVKVASAVSGSSVIYLGYGDAALNTDGSTTGAWNTAYRGVWHLPNGSSLTANDSTSNANNGTVTAATASAGQIDGAATFNGTTADITVGTGSSLNITTLPITFECWVKKTTASNIGPIFAKNIGGGGGYAVQIFNSGADLWFTKAGVADCIFSGVVPNDTNWNYFAVVADSTSVRCWVNPASTTVAGIVANTANMNSNGSTARMAYSSEAGTRLACSLDEPRISAASRSGDWILGSYNSQKAPGTFAPAGTEVPVGGSPKNPPPGFMFTGVL